MRRLVSLCLALVLLGQPAWAEEPKAKPGGASSGKASSGSARPARPSAPGRAAGESGTGASASGATETVALEIVAKAPKPIPPVELDMLQLRLMLTELKASFTDEIDRALFREPF